MPQNSAIDTSELLKQMLEEARAILKNAWSKYKEYFKKELKSFAENLRFIEKLKFEGKISEEQARLYFGLQKESMRVILTTMTGLAILTIEQIINAVLKLVCGLVSQLLGWSLC